MPRPSFDLSQLPVRVLTFAAVVFAGAVATTGIGAAVGLGSNILAADLHKLLARRLGSAEELLRNHDLALAVGVAIASVIQAEAKEPANRKDRGGLKYLAKHAPERWVQMTTSASPVTPVTPRELTEPELLKLFSPAADAVPALDDGDWKRLLDLLCQPQAGTGIRDVSLHDGTLAGVAERLRSGFTQALQGVLKHDFTHGGTAYPGMVLLSLGEIAAASRGAAENAQALRAHVEEQEVLLRRVEARTRVNEQACAALQGTIESLDAKQRQRLDPVIQDLKGLEPRLADAIEKQGGRIEQRITKEATRIITEVSQKKVPPAPPQPLGPHLPPTIGDSFVDRENRLNVLRRHFLTPSGEPKDPVKPLALTANGGFGKSRTACEFAHETDGVYATRLMLRASSQSILEREIAKLSQIPSLAIQRDVPPVEAMLAQLPQLAPQGLLIIFDGVDDEEAAAWLKDKVIQRLGAAHIVVTTRLRKWGRSVQETELSVLPAGEAERYLMESRTSDTPKPSDELKAVRDLAAALGFLPLALESAAAYVRVEGVSYAEYLALLRQEPSQPLKWRDGIELEYPEAVWNAYQLTWGRIRERNPLAWGILNWSAWFGLAPIPTRLWPREPGSEVVSEIGRRGGPEAAAFASEWKSHLEASLRVLSRYSQVEGWEEDERAYSLHPVVRSILRASVPDEHVLDALLCPLAALALASDGDFSNPHYWRWWEEIRPHVESVLEDAEKAHAVHPTTLLMSRHGNYFLARGAYDKAEPLLRRAIEIDEAAWIESSGEWYCVAEEPSFPSLYARHLANLSALLGRTNRLSEAERLLNGAIDLLQDHAPDDPFIATLKHDLGALLAQADQRVEAEALLRDATRMDEAALKPHDPDIARDLSSLGRLLTDLNRFDEAESALRRAARIDAMWRNPAPTDRVVGNILFFEGPRQFDKRWEEAHPYAQQITATFPKRVRKHYARYVPALARDLASLAALRTKQGREEEAIRLLQRSLAIYWYNWGPFHPDTESVWDKLNQLGPLVRCDVGEASYYDWVFAMIAMEFQALETNERT